MYRILIISILQLNKNEMHLKYVYSFNLGEKQAGGMTYLGFPTIVLKTKPVPGVSVRTYFKADFLCFMFPTPMLQKMELWSNQ